MRWSAAFGTMAAPFLFFVVGACGDVANRGVDPESPVAAQVPEATDPSARPGAGETRIRVLVRDFAGAPLAGALVAASPPALRPSRGWPGLDGPTATSEWSSLPPSWDLAPRAETRTGADGRCELRGLPAGLWRISAESPGRVVRATECRLEGAGAPPEVEVRAEPGFALTGRVTARSGDAIAGSFVLAEYAPVSPDGRGGRRPDDFAVARADLAGRFRFDALPGGTVFLRCGPPGAWSSHAWPVRIPSVSTIELRMETCGPVTGVVRSETDGSPVAGAEVVLSVATWHAARATAIATTAADGRFEIPHYPGFGVNEIAVNAAGWWPAPRVVSGRQPPFRLYEDRPTVIDLSVRRDAPEFAAIRGVVRGPDGPVAEASVSLYTEDDEDAWFGRARTDAQGRFHVPDLPDRAVTISVSGAQGLYQPGEDELRREAGGATATVLSGHVPADAPRPVDVEIVLRRGGRISGRVVDDAGAPVGGAEVAAHGAVTTSAADGTFVVDGTGEPEATTVYASDRESGRYGQCAAGVAGVGADVSGVELRIARVDHSRTVVVTGRIRAGDGVPIRDAWVTADSGRVPVGADGTFRAETTAGPGQTEIWWSAAVPGWGASETELPLAPGATAVDAGEILVPQAGGIRGLVEGPEGPLAGVLVHLEDRSLGGRTWCGFDEDLQPPIAAVTDDLGAFEARDVRAGKYTVRVEPPGLHEETKFVDVEAGESAWAGVVRVARESWIRGRVVLPDGSPVAGAEISADTVVARGESIGRFRDSTTTRPDGGFEVRVRDGDRCVLHVSPGDDAAESEDSGDDPRPTQFVRFRSPPLESGSTGKELVVPPGLPIRGRVVGPDGAPVAGARVTCRPASDDWNDRDTTTDPTGAFEFGALGEGAHTVSAALGLEPDVVAKDVAPGSPDVTLRIAAPSTIEGTLVLGDGRPAAGRTLVAVPADGDSEHRVTATTDAAGRFRIVGAGAAPCRIEVRPEPDGPDRWKRDWPLAGGARVAPGSQDVALRFATAEETTVSGRVADDAGKPFNAFRMNIRSSSGSTFHSGNFAGPEFSASGLPLDQPCVIDVAVAGLRWQISVPTGTRDLVLTAGADGLHRVEFGGRTVGTLPVDLWMEPVDVPRLVRFVQPVTGAVHEVPEFRGRRLVNAITPTVRIADVPVAPWRVEVWNDEYESWVPCRPSTRNGEAVLVLGE